MRGKGFRLKKTGIAKAKKYKNRIYLRKKGNNKNRKKKDFFPPYRFISKTFVVVPKNETTCFHEVFCTWQVKLQLNLTISDQGAYK